MIIGILRGCGHTSTRHDHPIRVHQRPCRRDNGRWSSGARKSDVAEFETYFG